MEKIKSSFDEKQSSTSPDIQQEVSMEFAISRRIHELMSERGLSQLPFAR